MIDGRYTILLVDDSPGDVHLSKLALKAGPFDCDVLVAENGRQAMALLRRIQDGNEFPPDLILLDLNMPQMDGRELLREVKADRGLAGIPVVVLTTSDVENDIASSYVLGAAGYVTKPTDLDDLFKMLHSVEDYWFSVVRLPKTRRAVAGGG